MAPAGASCCDGALRLSPVHRLAGHPPQGGARELAGVLCAALLAIGCRAEAVSEVTVVVGPGPENRASFVPKSAFAEYSELPGDHNELRIRLASHEASCDRYVPPGDGQAAISVLVVTPASVLPGEGEYVWNQLPTPSEPVARAYALPKAHIGKKSHLFQPGGVLRLRRVELASHGSVEGVLDFAFPGDAQHVATRVEGSFKAKLCPFTEAKP